ncbi:hypothetical protein ACFXPA_03920 [Amycolatopsis sp. NPDC059090]|uniref:hypothetical protein n=1 Tax=unclassified Amycolatopsis TaxID=2618356 RepID=UPI00366EE179
MPPVAVVTGAGTGVRRAEREPGPIDVGANVAFSSRFADLRSEEYRRDTEVAYLGFGQTGLPQPPGQPANLREPADGPRGFDQQAKGHAVQPVLNHGAVTGQPLRRTVKSEKDCRFRCWARKVRW